MKNFLLFMKKHDQDSRFSHGGHAHACWATVDDWRGEREKEIFLFSSSFLSHLIQLVIALNHFLCKF